MSLMDAEPSDFITPQITTLFDSVNNYLKILYLDDLINTYYLILSELYRLKALSELSVTFTFDDRSNDPFGYYQHSNFAHIAKCANLEKLTVLSIGINTAWEALSFGIIYLHYIN